MSRSQWWKLWSCGVVLTTLAVFSVFQLAETASAQGFGYSSGSGSSGSSGGDGGNPYLLYTDWYIDTANTVGCSSNSNSGNSATCTGGCAGSVCTSGIGPLLSGQTIINRWGTASPILAQTTSWHVLSSQPLNYEKIVLSPTLVNGSNFVIVGTPLAVGSSFTAGTVTPKSVGNPGQLLSIAAMPVGVVAGQMVQKSDNSVAFVDAVNPGVSGGTAVMTQPVTGVSVTTVTVNPVPTEVNTWATGNTLQLFSLPFFNLEVINPQGGDTTLALTTPTTWIQYLTIPDSTGTVGKSSFSPSLNGAGGITFAACVIQPYLTLDGDFNSANLISDWMPGGSGMYGTFSFAGASNTALTFETSLLGGDVDGDILLHGLTEVQSGNFHQTMGAVYTDSRFALIHGPVMSMHVGADPTVAITSPGGDIWGPGGIDLEPPNSSWQIVPATGATFTNALLVNSLEMSSVASGSVLVNANTLSGVVQAYRSGITLNVTNLDLYGGLQNPLTGTKFMTAAN